jgi:hypothetical protein
MKSPWKFLAQLTSRTRSAQTRESEVAIDAEASETGARQTSAPSSNSTAASSDHEEKPTVDIVPATPFKEIDGDLDLPQALSPIDGVEVHTPALHEVSGSGADAHVSEPEIQESRKRAPRTKRAKRTRTDVVSDSTAVSIGAQTAQSSSFRFFDEVQRLDEEIMQLRSQLAQKLHLQNAQLTKMLERFNGS